MRCRAAVVAHARLAAAAGRHHGGLFLALHARTRLADDVHPAAVMGDDAVQFGERLDLVDDHLAHLRGALGGLLRHFQHAAAQLVAGRLELVMHLGRHLLHARNQVGEAFGGLLEHRIGFFRGLPVDVVHGLDGLPVLLLGRDADRLELPADRGRSRAGGLGDDARDIAGALLGGGERFIQQAGEARQPLIEVGGTQVDGGDQRFQRGLALGDRGGGGAVGLLDHGGGLDQRAAMGVELGGERTQVLERLRGLVVEDAELVFAASGSPRRCAR